MVRKMILWAALVAALSLVFSVAAQEAEPTFTGDPIYVGVSGPLTGNLAQYGAQWQKGFDLALETINGAGGIDGRELRYSFEDSQSDPTQSVVVAQQFVADERIIAELGDFSSTASMAASPIYERGGLVQFGFTNTHPDFTFAGGDYTWSISVTQAQLSPALADFAVERLGLKNLAVFQINNDWGLATYDLFVPRAEELGATIVSTQSYLPEDTDFRSALTTIRNSDADGIILISYAPDAALIAQQARDTGIELPFIGSGSLQTADFLTLGAEAVEGTQLIAQFLPTDPRPAVQDFVAAYDAAYEEVPDLFAVIAYDSMNVIAEAIRLGGPTREGVLEGLRELEEVPSVLYGSITFDLETRRVLNPQFVDLVIKDGAFVSAVEQAAP
jgi:branched-chain amino acid transport system substrate-binding protein